MAQSLFLKYRPNTFDQIVGQKHIVSALKGALASNKVAHTYLFCGPRGTGKTTSARILAKSILCEDCKDGLCDNTCENCNLANKLVHPDIYELDAASRTGVDSVRDDIIKNLNYAPESGKAKIYIIDEVHMLSKSAFNALLKTLEEPPTHVYFILCTTDPQKIVETVLSRCQRFDFQRLDIKDIVKYLSFICKSEGINYEEEALYFIAKSCNGGMRDACVALEKIATANNANIELNDAKVSLGQLDLATIYSFIDATYSKKMNIIFTNLNDINQKGMDLSNFAYELCRQVKNIYVYKMTQNKNIIEAVSDSDIQYIEELSQKIDAAFLYRAISLLAEYLKNLNCYEDKYLMLEICITKICNPQTQKDFKAIDQRLSLLENALIKNQTSNLTSNIESNDNESLTNKENIQSINAESIEISKETDAQTTSEANNNDSKDEQIDNLDQIESLPAKDDNDKLDVLEDKEEQIDTQIQDPTAKIPLTGMTNTRLFVAVKSKIGQKDDSLIALLEDANLENDEQYFYLVFPDELTFSMDLCNAADNFKEIALAFESVLSTKAKIKCISSSDFKKIKTPSSNVTSNNKHNEGVPELDKSEFNNQNNDDTKQHSIADKNDSLNNDEYFDSYVNDDYYSYSDVSVESESSDTHASNNQFAADEIKNNSVTEAPVQTNGSNFSDSTSTQNNDLSNNETDEVLESLKFWGEDIKIEEIPNKDN
ncbi:MAG: DNA polymerase III subunit gamma/tau [Coriobacteriales bacterium]|nr:DNA polymerase III subunit gamma/tau [Coriobacteriales bacterium]